MKKILVTGSSGNVGSFVIKSLKGLVIGCIGTSSKKVEKTTSETVYFDFLNKETFDEALKDVDGVFLMRPPHIGEPSDMYPFLDSVKHQNIKLLCFLSLMGIENNTIPPHYKIEKYIEKLEIPHCHIRPGFFMQNLSGVHAKEIKEDGSIYIPASSSKCSFVDTMDIGDFIGKIFSEYEKHVNTAYVVTGKESLDYFQIAEIMSKVLNKKIVYDNPALISFWTYMVWKRGMPMNYVNVMCALYVMTRFGAGELVTDDFERIMGREPTKFKDFVKENMSIWQ